MSSIIIPVVLLFLNSTGCSDACRTVPLARSQHLATSLQAPRALLCTWWWRSCDTRDAVRGVTHTLATICACVTSQMLSGLRLVLQRWVNCHVRVGWSRQKEEAAVLKGSQKRLWGLLCQEERIPLYKEGYCHFPWLSQFLFCRPRQWSTFRELGRLSVMVLDSRILSLMAQTVSHLLSSSSLVTNAEHLMMAKYQILPKLVTLFVFSCPTSSAPW